jgi:hypothetical protein
MEIEQGLTFDNAETYANAFTRKQMEEAMSTFDRIRPLYPNVREAFVRAVELQLIKIGRRIDEHG